jgi:hypothetical protein
MTQFDLTRLDIRHNRPLYDGLHPVIYRAIVVLALWLVVSVWVFFSGSAGYDDLSFAVVTGLFVIAIAIPGLLWLTWRRNSDEGHNATPPRFRDWRSGDLATWTGRHAAPRAAIEALLPIAAVAFGMTAIGLVFLFAAT